ncbi:MAG TPA: alkaline phosphatase family protein [Anaerolineaceae bacterium]|nr:alkaline phosphatase family protein [Anaerolineaceae bacterium]
MPDLSPVVLPVLERHRLPGLAAGAGQVHPLYDGYSLGNLPASVARWLGLQGPPGSVPLADPLLAGLPGTFRQVIVLLADGLGYNLFTRFLAMPPWSQLLPEAAFAPLTSVVPSTTAAALTTLWTGALPAEHGTVGYELFLKEYGLIANMLLHTPASYAGDAGSLRRAGFDPQAFLPVPGFGSYLAQHGVGVYAFQPAGISSSGLSQMLFAGAEVLPYRTWSDLTVNLRDLLAGASPQRSYIYLYWPDIDTLSHRYGPNDERVRLEFEQFSYAFSRMIAALRAVSRGDTLLVLLADHGLIETPRVTTFELRHHPRFVERLTMQPSGENRLPFLFVRPGHQAAVEAYVETHWPGQFWLCDSEQAVASGLMGNGRLSDRLLDRLGDRLVIPQGDAYWWWANRDNPMLGRHGGLSRAEMLVPFFALAV